MAGGGGRALACMVRELLPGMVGAPLRIRMVRDLSGKTGKSVHAGSNIPKREILLDAELLDDRGELTRILLHEVFHFAWVRLGNPRRLAYEAVLEAELRNRAKGELGWSAEWRKDKLSRWDRSARSRKWREYVCESFCDTGAWVYAGLKSHEEWTLPVRFRKKRRAWLVRIIEEGELRA